MEMGPSPGGRGDGKPPSPHQSPSRAPGQDWPWGSTAPAPPPPAATAPLPGLPGTAPHFSHGFAVTHLPSSLPTVLGSMEAKAVPKSPSSSKGWARDTGVTAGPAPGRWQEIMPGPLPRDGARPATLPPELQIGAEATDSLSPKAPAALGLEEKLPRGSRTPRIQNPPVSRKRRCLSACHGNPPAWTRSRRPVAHGCPVCFQASHLQTQACRSEIPPSRAGHPDGWAFGGAERLQFSSVEQMRIRPPSPQPALAA